MATNNTFLILLLGFSFLVSTFKAIPISRTMNLIDEGSLEVSSNTHLTHENLEENWDGRRLSRRMDISTNDYPGSGTMNLIDEGSLEVSSNTHLTHENLEENWDGRSLSRRMDISTNDYLGSGANDRHTPMP